MIRENRTDNIYLIIELYIASNEYSTIHIKYTTQHAGSFITWSVEWE